jgi:malate dehydrogenase (oxaloacetate-decarboxylating)(NADP+)
MSIDRQDALDYHAGERPGKIEVIPTKPVATADDLSLAYSPGVAEPCREIHKEPLDVFKYTARGNLVAVVSNGTAVLGIGNIGALASKPVMEGKGVLFKKFAGIDVFDIEVDSEDPDEVIRFCQLLEPTIGGVNLEDIAAPECFVIERTLKETMDVPVFHDDQHGTAIIGGAALLNALEIVGKTLDKVRIVFSGAGASAIATGEHLLRMGATLENIIMVDSKGVIHKGRLNEVNEYKAKFAVNTDARTLADAMVGADVFVGLSVKGAVTRDMVAPMAKDPIIFALANPDPEILPEEVAEVRDDAIMATGRSDYPNQVNNVLGFPFIFRGALDVRSTAINPEMMLAATYALQELAKTDVPESVEMAYGGEHFDFGRNYLIPKPFDPRVRFYVSPAVAKAAMETGVARIQLDLDEYRDRLKASLGPGWHFMRLMVNRAREKTLNVVLAEGESERVIRAAGQVVEEGIARPILVGDADSIRQKAEEFGVGLRGVQIIDPTLAREARGRYAEELYRRRLRKGLTRSEARANMYKPIYFASAMVRAGEADALVAGMESNMPEALKPAIQVVGTADGVRHVAGLHMVTLPHRDPLIFADTTVNIDPEVETLAEIALLAAQFAQEIGMKPRIAMLSFSNFGSVRHPYSEKVREAAERVRLLAPTLEVDGEMQADAALNTRMLGDGFPFCHLSKPANILVFPNLSAANACQKILDQVAEAEVIGPILMGMARPVQVLERGSSVQEVVDLVTIATVDAQARMMTPSEVPELASVHD